METREVTAIEAAIEILKDIKEAADKGIMWRNPDHYPEEYRKNYEAVVSEIVGKAIATLEGLPPHSFFQSIPHPKGDTNERIGKKND